MEMERRVNELSIISLNMNNTEQTFFFGCNDMCLLYPYGDVDTMTEMAIKLLADETK